MFEKGHNKIGGATKGSKHLFAMGEFKKAFEADEAKHDNNIFQFFFEQARKDGGAVLVALMRKILPDMKQVEVMRKYEGGFADMTPAEACKQMDKATIGNVPDSKT